MPSPAEDALRAAGRPGLTLRVTVEQEEYAAGLYLSNDQAEDDEDELVIAQRAPTGRWTAWTSGGGKGSRADRRRFAIGVGSGGGVGRKNGSAEVHSHVGGRIINLAVARIEITFSDGSRRLARLANGGYLWFHAEGGYPLRRLRRWRLPEIPDRLQPVLVVAYDASGNELQWQELGLHRHLPRPPRPRVPLVENKGAAPMRLYEFRDRSGKGNSDGRE